MSVWCFIDVADALYAVINSVSDNSMFYVQPRMMYDAVCSELML